MTETLKEVREADGIGTPPASGRGRAAWRFTLHYAEMVIAMVAGMIFFGPLWKVLYEPLGWSGLFERPDVAAMTMATDMTVGMSIWMRHRGHGWAPVAEMGAAMYAPFLVLLVPYWTGALSGGDLMMGGHALMLPAMAVAMLARRREYTGHHHSHRHSHGHEGDGHGEGAPEHDGTAGRVLGALKRRWPTWLALVITIGTVYDPSAPPAVILVLLQGLYLFLGVVRKTLDGPGTLAVQLGGLAAYIALVVATMMVDERTALYLIAAGWLLHAVWDVVHHRLGKVVPRGYAEWCTIYDVGVGLTILFLVV
ncbi:hypothetical protein ACFY4C_14380 [Actinomadura viridis]|uniref:hypothetical protein n=1 Tax=Actinomadura viridis TaxID=58110 RepID=UPI0036AE9B15